MPAIRVLIVDDHDMVRKGIRSWLEAEADIEVIDDVSSGKEALDKVKILKPDVMMLDLHLPDMHGMDVIRKLRSEKNDTPILVMTGYEKQRAKAVLEAGANGFINKEEQRERVIDAVRWAASKEVGNWISPSIAGELMKTDSAITKADLTKTELKVISLIEKGNSEIAEKLFISEGTVKNHLTNLYSKLNVKTRLEAAAWARKFGLIETDA